MKDNLQLKKNFIWNIIGTSFNSFNSLFLMILVTRINGTGNAGIYTLAFSTASILYMIGIYAGRIYQVTESDKRINDKDYILNRIISCLAIFVFSILFVIIRRYNLYKSSIFIILALYRTLDAFSEVIYGIFQKNDLLYKAGKSSFIKAILSISVFGIVDFLTKNLVYSLISFVFVYLLILFVYDFTNVKKLVDKNEKAEVKKALSIFIGGFFTFALSFLGVYMSNAQKYAIDNFMTEDVQAVFGIIIMPATVMGLLAQFLIHPYLNKIFELYKSNIYSEIKKILYKIIFTIAVIGAICSSLGFFLGTTILGIVYNMDLSSYSISLTLILVAATFYTMAGIISPILITMRCTKIQFIIYLLISVFEWIISNTLVYKFGFNGAISAYFITMIVYFVVFYTVAMSIINKKDKKIKKGEENGKI